VEVSINASRDTTVGVERSSSGRIAAIILGLVDSFFLVIAVEATCPIAASK